MVIGWFERHNILSWMITIIIAIVIFYVSSLSFAPGAGGFGFQTILYHFYAFFFLSFSLLISLIQGKARNKYFIIAVIFILIMYAVSDEVHQLFVQGRSCSFSDFLIDSAGILSASILYSLPFAFGK